MRLYCSQKKSKQPFHPINPDCPTMYVCGPTVYSHPHIGNARPCVVFDLLYRVLKAQYPEVKYCRNITDLDDKINQAAQQRGVEIKVITDQYTKAYHQDAQALGCLSPTVEPRATEHIPEMIELVQRLVAQGYAYESAQHVLFSVPSYQAYGQLSGRSSDARMAGARVDVSDYKRHPEDFVLWKPSSVNEPAWESPWGAGRPGWHLECSAMSEKHLGLPFDIHGGGGDLLFPHHENERAQSCCASGSADYAKLWLHNGMITVNDEKMSKSVGNILLVKDLLEQAPGEVIRYQLLQTHYRQPLHWKTADLAQTKRALDRFYRAIQALDTVVIADQVLSWQGLWESVPADIQRALADDLNTPEALRLWQLLCKQALAVDMNSDEAMAIKRSIMAVAKVLGLGQIGWQSWFKGDVGVADAEVLALLAKRQQARANKDFQAADAIRAELDALGIVLEDQAGQTTWRRK